MAGRIEDGRATGLLLIDVAGSAPHVHHCPLGNGRHIDTACPVPRGELNTKTQAFERRDFHMEDVLSVHPMSPFLTYAYLWHPAVIG